MKLYLVRHGEAASESIDPTRPLSGEGKSAVGKLAKFLKRAGIRVNTFYCSSKKRAEQTALILKETLNPDGKLITKDNFLPDDSTDELVYELSGERVDVMIIGHLPYLSKLVSRLVMGNEDKAIVEFPTSSVIILERDQERNWYIMAMVTPDLLK